MERSGADPRGRSSDTSGTSNARWLSGLLAEPLGDRSELFTFVLPASWVLCVAVPLVGSILLARPALGLPLLAAAMWFGLLRLARWLSPPARCERLLARGHYQAATELCRRELNVRGPTAWQGNRRLAWLNRLTAALLGMGEIGEASVAALEALAERPDPETLANCAQSLLWLNRYNEAVTAARLALSLTKERSVSSHAVLATVLLAEGRPAEAQAAAAAGMADVEALLPFVQPAHHVSLLAALCRADRMLGDEPQAQKHLAALKRAAGRNLSFQARVLVEEADERASAGDNEAALQLLQRATELAPHYVWWFAHQPHTLIELHSDRQLHELLARARAAWTRNAGGATGDRAPEYGAAPAAYVAMELAAAQERGYVRPAPHASRRALTVQMLTVACTLGLLVWWTWRFFLSG